MSNVIEFPQIPMWNPNINIEGLSKFVLNKTNIKEWVSYFQNETTQLEIYDGNEDLRYQRSMKNEFLEDLQSYIEERGFIVISLEVLNDE